MNDEMGQTNIFLKYFLEGFKIYKIINFNFRCRDNFVNVNCFFFFAKILIFVKSFKNRMIFNKVMSQKPQNLDQILLNKNLPKIAKFLEVFWAIICSKSSDFNKRRCLVCSAPVLCVCTGAFTSCLI